MECVPVRSFSEGGERQGEIRSRLVYATVTMNMQRGFIQIPIILLWMLGAFAVTAGGLAIKHFSTSQPVPKEQTVATTTAVIPPLSDYAEKYLVEKETQDQCAGKGLACLLATAQKDNKSLALSKSFPATKPTQSLSKNIANWIDYTQKAKALIVLLEQDRNNFKLFTDTIAKHKKQSAGLAIKIFNGWIALADSTANSVSSEYRMILITTKQAISSDMNFVVNDSNYLYDSVSGTYSLNQQEQNSLAVIEGGIRKCLALDEKTWSVSSDLYCAVDFSDSMSEQTKGYADRLMSGFSRLGEVDRIVLDTISTHSTYAQKDIQRDVSSITDMANIVANTQASLNNISAQYQQQSQALQVANTPIVCHTTNTGGILSWNSTTTCSPDTRTTAQICASQIAAWLANGAVPPKPCND